MKRIITILGVALFVVTACSTDAQVASQNISKAADQFEVFRRVTAYSGFNGEAILRLEGYCNYEEKSGAGTDRTRVLFTCKVEDGIFTRPTVGLGDNDSYVVEQLYGIEASTAQYRLIIKPSAIIPDIDFE